VQPETASWLNESRGSLGAAQSRFNDVSSMDGTGAGALFMSAEYAVKAVIVGSSHPTCGRTWPRWRPSTPTSSTPARPDSRDTRHEHTRPWFRRHRRRSGSSAWSRVSDGLCGGERRIPA